MLFDDRHKIGGRIAPTAASQPVAERLETRPPLFLVRAPGEQALDQVVDVLRIRKQQRRERRIVLLGYARRSGDHGGYAAANRLLHVQAVGFVSNRTDEQVGRGQYALDLIGESEQTDAICQARLLALWPAMPAPPDRCRPPSNRHPNRAASIASPRRETGRRSPCGRRIPEPPTKTARLRDSETCSRFLVAARSSGGNRAPRWIATQVDGVHALRIDAEVFHEFIGGALGIGNYQPRPLKGGLFGAPGLLAATASFNR